MSQDTPNSKSTDNKHYDAQSTESKWQQQWFADSVYHWQGSDRAQSYIIDTPPPTVSGTLHLGHVYSYTQADLLARYQRMAGRDVFYPIGFDDNGLPTERLVEKLRGVKAADMSREEFVRLCQETVVQSEVDFRALFKSIGLSFDWRQEYQTISGTSTRLSQMSVLDLFHKGHLERKPQPTLWDPADRTALAQAEIVEKEQPGTLWRIAFALEGAAGTEVVIATTRPELLGACGALIISPLHPRAAELLGKNAVSPLYGVPVPIIADDKADPEKGTGIVMCCTFGDTTDIEWWQKHNLPLRVILDASGRLTDMPHFGGADWPSHNKEAATVISALKGLSAKQARAKIIEILAAQNLLRGEEAVTRMVPCAERSGAPLEILITAQWFVKLLDKKQQLLEAGRAVRWSPDYMRVRFEQWTENLKWDWCISRQRFFGVPFPFWYSKRAGEEGKILTAHLDDLPVNPLVDLPRGYAAHEVEPERDVMDTWATSSISPQLNSHGVAEGYMLDSARHEKLFPAHLRPQAHEIIRTWAFYTIAKSVLHAGVAPWRDIALSGWCLAEDRSKMSKSKGNIIDPRDLLARHSADAVRYWTATSRLGLDTTVSEDVMKVGKRLMTKLWNAARFAHLQLGGAVFTGTANEAVAQGTIKNTLDIWLLSRLHDTIRTTTELQERYDYADALKATEEFFWKDLCDNYLELVKARIYADGSDAVGRLSAQATLYFVLETVLRLFAPTLPHITEELYSTLYPEKFANTGSLHKRGGWPQAADFPHDAKALIEGQHTVSILAAGRKAKSLANVSLKTSATRLVVLGIKALEPASAQDLAAALNAPLPEFLAAAVADLTEVASDDAAIIVQMALAAEAAAE